jgi:hypothetical protein
MTKQQHRYTDAGAFGPISPDRTLAATGARASASVLNQCVAQDQDSFPQPRASARGPPIQK